MKSSKAVAATVLGLVLGIGPWSVTTDSNARSTMDHLIAAESTVNQNSVVDTGRGMTGVAQAVEVSPQCYCVEYFRAAVPADSVTTRA
jgi:hypothetical protein